MDIEDTGDLVKNLVLDKDKENNIKNKKLISKNKIKDESNKKHIRIFIKTFGCSHNASDSEYMAGILASEGYEIVSNDAKKIRVNGTQYYQIIVKYENTVTVVANGLYNPKDNQIEYLEAGAPVDTLKLSLK